MNPDNRSFSTAAVLLAAVSLALPLSLRAESLEEISAKNAAALSSVSKQIEIGRKTSGLYCGQIASRMDLLMDGAYAGKKTLDIVAKILEEKAGALRRARSREVRVDRREAMDTFRTFSKVLRSGAEALSASSGLASDLLPELELDSKCEKARGLSTSSFQYVPAALRAPKRIASTVADVVDKFVVDLSDANSSEVIVNAWETADNFSDLASALRKGADTLRAARDAIDDAREKLK